VGETGANQDTVVAFAGIDDGTPQLAMSCMWWRTGQCISLAHADATPGRQPDCRPGMAQTLEISLGHLLPEQLPVQTIVWFETNAQHQYLTW
jgi:hypothetical protein